MRARPTRFLPVLLLASLVTATGWVLSGGVLAQGPPGQRTTDRVNGHDAVAGEGIVKYVAPRTTAELAQTDAIIAATSDDDLGGNGRLRHIRSDRFDAAALVSFFRGAPGVEYAEPNYIQYAIATPNDPGMPGLWGLLNTGLALPTNGTPGADIDATLAWNITTGSASNVVGVVDTGVDYNHRDLIGNIWTAPSSFTVTIGGQPVTCPAGSHGFNAITSTCDPMDDNNHGTHVSGTIGAHGDNGKGVVGVNWTAGIMALKFLNANGSGSTTGAINAIDFAIKAKQHFGSAANVRVLSNSWGCAGCFSQALLDKINEANTADMLFVAAAGNNGSNNDASPFYPSNYDAPNVVAVAATDQQRFARIVLELRCDHSGSWRARRLRALDDPEQRQQRLRLLQRHLDGDAARFRRSRARDVGVPDEHSQCQEPDSRQRRSDSVDDGHHRHRRTAQREQSRHRLQRAACTDEPVGDRRKWPGDAAMERIRGGSRVYHRAGDNQREQGLPQLDRADDLHGQRGCERYDVLLRRHCGEHERRAERALERGLRHAAVVRTSVR